MYNFVLKLHTWCKFYPFSKIWYSTLWPMIPQPPTVWILHHHPIPFLHPIQCSLNNILTSVLNAIQYHYFLRKFYFSIFIYYSRSTRYYRWMEWIWGNYSIQLNSWSNSILSLWYDSDQRLVQKFQDKGLEMVFAAFSLSWF